MNNNKLLSICFLLLLIFGQRGYSQTIEMEFPQFAGKTFEFVIFQGSKAVKVYENDTIPADGLVKIVIPKEYAPYTGMCRWLLTNSKTGGGLDMAIPGHDFRVSCLSDTPDESNIKYIGFDAVNELNRLHREQQVIIDKFETMSKAAQLYDPNHPLYASLVKEKEVQVKAFDEFQKGLKQNNNYNARFLPIVNLIKGLSPQLTDDYEQQAKSVNEYITHDLNFDDLYTSGHWTGIIQSWVQMHAQMYVDKANFIEAFNAISQRITESEKYTDFVGKVTYSLIQFGKDDFIEGIAPTVIGSGKITSYEGKTMQVYVRAIIGSPAPDLVITEHEGKVEDHLHRIATLKSSELATGEYKQTLLVFYQSGCGPCEQLMQQLPQQYAALKDKGVRIISLSADEGEQVYANSSRDYPWPDKYCDFKGKAGVNFSNYAVTGTPTLILLDKQGKVQLRVASLQEVETYLDQESLIDRKQ